MKNKIGKFSITGTAIDSQKSIPLDEIVLVADPAVVRDIGLFFISIAHEMTQTDLDHKHLQDFYRKFSHKKNVDIILCNKKQIKQS